MEIIPNSLFVRVRTWHFILRAEDGVLFTAMSTVPAAGLEELHAAGWWLLYLRRVMHVIECAE